MTRAWQCTVLQAKTSFSTWRWMTPWSTTTLACKENLTAVSGILPQAVLGVCRWAVTAKLRKVHSLERYWLSLTGHLNRLWTNSWWKTRVSGSLYRCRTGVFQGIDGFSQFHLFRWEVWDEVANCKKDGKAKEFSWFAVCRAWASAACWDCLEKIHVRLSHMYNSIYGTLHIRPLYHIPVIKRSSVKSAVIIAYRASLEWKLRLFHYDNAEGIAGNEADHRAMWDSGDNHRRWRFRGVQWWIPTEADNGTKTSSPGHLPLWSDVRGNRGELEMVIAQHLGVP